MNNTDPERSDCNAPEEEYGSTSKTKDMMESMNNPGGRVGGDDEEPKIVLSGRPPYHQQPMLVPVMLPMHPPVQQHLNHEPAYHHQQKWEQMFDCLVQFIQDTREKSTRHLTDEQKAHWVWDGNVPTSYKTQCGKALGRWINNQRSAKSKGSLKGDREVKLVSTGLKWNVTTSNSWTQMLEQLKIYVQSQTENGKQWDGNVPTNYKAGAGEEEKNLGRWVNRQRSLYQAGKLKKERQDDLNRIGLKWSVLSTWPTMYQSLCRYAEQQRKQSPNGWDGTVPPNFKTRENPSQSLGRWVNKQLSSHGKGRLSAEYVSQLESIGLNLHSRNTSEEEDTYEDDFTTGAEPDIIQSFNWL